MEATESRAKGAMGADRASLEQRLADLTRLSPDAILVNRDDRIEFANAAAIELFGARSADELLGRSPFLWFHPDDHLAVRSRIHCLLSGEASVPRRPLTIVRPDGSTRLAEAVASAFTDARGPALQVVLRDVTDRERTERALRAAHERLTQVVESISDAFYAVDADWRLTYLNRRTEQLWGRPREALLGRTLWELFPSYGENRGVAALRAAMTRRTPARFEVYSTVLGRWVETSAYPSADGGLSVFFQDVTEEHRRLDEFRRLSEALPQLVWMADAAGTLDFFNQRWRDYTGQTPGTESWEEAIHPADREGTTALWRAAVARGSDFELEHRLRRADGEYRWFIRRAFRLPAGEGRSDRWFGTCTDVHDLKLSQEVLRQADRLKEDFLNMASHEFRTPLTALRLQVELLRRALRKPEPSPERLERQLAGADAQIDRLEALLRSLLDVSVINAGRLTLDLTELDLGALVREVIDRLGPEAERQGSPVTLRAGPVLGCWDRTRLDQVLTNLLSNAVKYGAHRPVEVEVGEQGSAAVVVVRDRGIGIPPATLDRVFDRFERGGNTGAIKGSGLGLWITRKMVEAHGGEVAVESAVGAGSTFTVRLPLGTRRPGA